MLSGVGSEKLDELALPALDLRPFTHGSRDLHLMRMGRGDEDAEINILRPAEGDNGADIIEGGGPALLRPRIAPSPVPRLADIELEADLLPIHRGEIGARPLGHELLAWPMEEDLAAP